LKFKEHPNIKIDHLGNEYPSMSKMLEHYGISYTPFMYRLQVMKLSLKDALTRPTSSDLATAIRCKDHLGNEYKNVNEMCRNYGISASAYRDRIKKSMSVKDALTKPIRTTKIKDHLGNTYANQIEMTAAYGIDPKLFTARLAKGMSIEDALTLPRNYTAKPSTDHLGQTFATFEDLARHYNISAAALLRRLSYMSLEDALTKPKGFRGEYFDHEGNCFRSKTEMCRYWGISVTTYDYRINNGASVEQALSELTDNTRINNDSTVLTKVSTDYYECDIHGNKIILHISKIHELIRANIKDKPNKKRR
jgi:Zn-dependent peptidase ImmA (M78 family)